jgi:hypothetical protein
MKYVKVPVRVTKVTNSLKTRWIRLIFYIVLLTLLFVIAISKPPTPSGAGHAPPVSSHVI